MSRNLTEAMQAAVNSDVVYPILFTELKFDSGTVRFWSGYGNLTWSGSTWTGSQNLGSIGEIQEGQKLSAEGMTVSLSGIDSSIVSLVMNETYRGREANIWLGCTNSTDLSIIADPLKIFSGYMDTMTIEDGSETCTVIMSLENEMIRLKESSKLTSTDECQKKLHSTDTGYRYVAGLADKQIIWGR